MLERLTLTDFEPSIGASFGLDVGEQSMSMILRVARAIGGAPLGAATRTPFALEFETEGPPRIEQRTYTVTFPDGARVEIFLVPIKVTPSGGTRLEAIFT